MKESSRRGLGTGHLPKVLALHLTILLYVVAINFAGAGLALKAKAKMSKEPERTCGIYTKAGAGTLPVGSGNSLIYSANIE